MRNLFWAVCCVFVAGFVSGCQRSDRQFTGAAGEVRLITLAPGHFHAALVQKSMYEQVSAVVHVYAPDGGDVREHLKTVAGFNERAENPTSWDERVYLGEDFLERMIAEGKGNVVVVSGNNSAKTDYIFRAVEAGFNVLADKPMVISPEKFPLLVRAFEEARENDVLLYDIMTERYEITTILQRELSRIEDLFGELREGTEEEPAVTKESVHHFFKYVAGNAIRRPGWFFDFRQRGEGLVDVSTHLVDLIQWECFPEEIIDYRKDIEMLSARRWTTAMSGEEFTKVTGLAEFPDYLDEFVEDGMLNVYSNGEMNYRIKGVHAKVKVTWRFEAGEGGGDTHRSIMRGTLSNLVISQGEDEDFKATLYIEAAGEGEIDGAVARGIEKLGRRYAGIGVKRVGEGRWEVLIPDEYRTGHEAHFGQVTESYLGYLVDGELPVWEEPNMIAKYYTTTEALRMAME